MLSVNLFLEPTSTEQGWYSFLLKWKTGIFDEVQTQTVTSQTWSPLHNAATTAMDTSPVLP